MKPKKLPDLTDPKYFKQLITNLYPTIKEVHFFTLVLSLFIAVFTSGFYEQLPTLIMELFAGTWVAGTTIMLLAMGALGALVYCLKKMVNDKPLKHRHKVTAVRIYFFVLAGFTCLGLYEYLPSFSIKNVVGFVHFGVLLYFFFLSILRLVFIRESVWPQRDKILANRLGNHQYTGTGFLLATGLVVSFSFWLGASNDGIFIITALSHLYAQIVLEQLEKIGAPIIEN